MKVFIFLFILSLSNPIWAKKSALVIGGGCEDTGPSDKNMFHGDMHAISRGLDKNGWHTQPMVDDHASDRYARDRRNQNISTNKSPTKEELLAYLDGVANDNTNEQFLMHINTHGLPGNDGVHSICLANGFKLPINDSDLKEKLQAIKDKNIKIGIIDDSCYGGGSVSHLAEYGCVMSGTASNNVVPNHINMGKSLISLLNETGNNRTTTRHPQNSISMSDVYNHTLLQNTTNRSTNNLVAYTAPLISTDPTSNTAGEAALTLRSLGVNKDAPAPAATIIRGGGSVEKIDTAVDMWDYLHGHNYNLENCSEELHSLMVGRMRSFITDFGGSLAELDTQATRELYTRFSGRDESPTSVNTQLNTAFNNMSSAYSEYHTLNEQFDARNLSRQESTQLLVDESADYNLEIPLPAAMATKLMAMLKNASKDAIISFKHNLDLTDGVLTLKDRYFANPPGVNGPNTNNLQELVQSDIEAFIEQEIEFRTYAAEDDGVKLEIPSIFSETITLPSTINALDTEHFNALDEEKKSSIRGSYRLYYERNEKVVELEKELIVKRHELKRLQSTFLSASSRARAYRQINREITGRSQTNTPSTNHCSNFTLAD